ncbi:unnamed protein product [Bemisia tabaci]|uniref:DNA polymerase delta subunit 2 n=2 Tax=Bemisia tabaci TaxID=7038 RepID=A0A9P0F4Z2_BEMTA|nr:unnamed protein product [Bemisia tabaci]
MLPKMSPSIADMDASGEVKRLDCEYKDLSAPFRLQERDYYRQFFNLYAVRLNKMREWLLACVEKKWGKKYAVKRLTDLKEGDDSCICVGTLFKHQELKPSILKEISEDNQLMPLPKRTHFVSDEDKLILEDELQRMPLIGSLNVHELVTGCVVAVLGKPSTGGKFQVEDVCWPSPTNPIYSTPHVQNDRLLVLVSGFDLVGSSDSVFPIELFIDWATGLIGNPADQSRIVRVIVAGNSFRSQSEPEADIFAKFGNTTQKDNINANLLAARQLDDILNQLSTSVDVELMPGAFDPTNNSLPQQPLHFCMFPKASKNITFHGATNPHMFELGSRLVVGTSGQSVADITAFSKIEDPLVALEKTLEWGHLMPTAPDTLACYPFYKEDPFIMNNKPDIYFVGNQDSFQTKLVNSSDEDSPTRLVCVPKFATTFTCAVVNLATLDCYPVSFNVKKVTTG